MKKDKAIQMQQNPYHLLDDLAQIVLQVVLENYKVSNPYDNQQDTSIS